MKRLGDLFTKYIANFWPDLPLEEQWRRVLMGEDPAMRRYRHILAHLPADPRCLFCNAPFRGPLAPFMQLIDRSPSSMNPRYCRMCLETIPVGGAEIEHSMLFADVRGSTTLAEQLGAAEYGHLINRFFALASDILTRSDALVDKLMGDQAIGLYVPGFAGPEHAAKAVGAGLKLLEATGHGGPEEPWLPIGVGVHTGVSFVGAMGKDGGVTNVTALGDAVNVAARLSTQAAAGELLVTADAATAAGLDTKDLEHRTLTLKGREEPVEVFVCRVGNYD